ncbi:hypothetical protein OPIT5_00600 [Opitutaceae bacterium TAV5]|nr:hypothetical protein OPIT5_00600 [Opitutaceae bacterium TAV5]
MGKTDLFPEVLAIRASRSPAVAERPACLMMTENIRLMFHASSGSPRLFPTIRLW